MSPPPSAGQNAKSVNFVTIFALVYFVFVCLWIVAQTRAESSPHIFSRASGKRTRMWSTTAHATLGSWEEPHPTAREMTGKSKQRTVYIFVCDGSTAVFGFGQRTHSFCCVPIFRLVHRTGEGGACERPKRKPLTAHLCHANCRYV